MAGSPFDFMSLPSITGGAAGPSNATSNTSSYVAMNNPFSVAGQGGEASSSATGSGTWADKQTIIFLAIIAAIIMVAK